MATGTGLLAWRFPALEQGGCGDDSGWGLAASEEIELGLTHIRKKTVVSLRNVTESGWIAITSEIFQGRRR